MHVIKHVMKLYNNGWITASAKEGEYRIKYIYDIYDDMTFKVTKDVYTLLKNIQNQSNKNDSQ